MTIFHAYITYYTTLPVNIYPLAMRSSTLLAVAAAAGPAFAAPIAAPAESYEVKSGTALDSGAISTFTRLVAPLVDFFNSRYARLPSPLSL